MLPCAVDKAHAAESVSLRECEEMVQTHINMARTIVKTHRQSIVAMVNDLPAYNDLHHLWEKKKEELKWAWELEKAVVTYLLKKHGENGVADEQRMMEVNASVAYYDSELECLEVWATARNKQVHINRAIVKQLKMERDLGLLQSEFNMRVCALHKELGGGRIARDEAFKNAGLKCDCRNPECGLHVFAHG